MTEEKALLQAITANRTDDLPRLAYADWFDEAASSDNSYAARAEFIRAQVWLARDADNEGNRLTPERRSEFETISADLLKEHRQEWELYIRTILGNSCVQIYWVRGFPSGIRVDDFQPLLDSGLLESTTLTTLNLWGNLIGNIGVQALATSPQLGNLTTLNLGNNQIGDAGVQALANSPHLGNLTILDLAFNRIGDAGVQTLANSPHLGSLTTLDLAHNRIGAVGAEAFANSPHLGNLTTLYLGGNEIGEAGARALATSPHLGNLTTLDLAYNEIGDMGVQTLANSPHLGNLTTLDLAYSRIGPVGIEALANSPYLGNLTTLDLAHNRLGAVGTEALASSRYLTPEAKRSGLESAGSSTLANHVRREGQRGGHEGGR